MTFHITWATGLEERMTYKANVQKDRIKVITITTQKKIEGKIFR